MSEETRETQETESKDNERQDRQQQIVDMGSATIRTESGTIYTLTIVGQIEGHQILPPTAKTTKYEHVMPLLASVEESDVDLLVEFVTPSVSLLTLSSLQLQLEEELQVSVDLVHLPLPEKTLLILGEVIELYEKPGPTDSDQNPGGGRGGF